MKIWFICVFVFLIIELDCMYFGILFIFLEYVWVYFFFVYFISNGMLVVLNVMYEFLNFVIINVE